MNYMNPVYPMYPVYPMDLMNLLVHSDAVDLVLLIYDFIS